MNRSFRLTVFNAVIGLVNKFLSFENKIPFIRERVHQEDFELELLAWRYAFARTTMVAEVRCAGGVGLSGEAYKKAKETALAIEREHGVRLREYLTPYRNHTLPQGMELNHWSLWYAATLLGSV